MANDSDMLRDIDTLLADEKTNQQGLDLDDIYFFAFIEPDEREVEKLKAFYVKKYGSIDNYI